MNVLIVIALLMVLLCLVLVLAACRLAAHLESKQVASEADNHEFDKFKV